MACDCTKAEEEKQLCRPDFGGGDNTAPTRILYSAWPQSQDRMAGCGVLQISDQPLTS